MRRELPGRASHELAAEDGLQQGPDERGLYTGVEIGGALKNVFAIAAGAVTGAGLGASAQAAMVTRGFVELRRIGAAFGAEPETLMGLSGLGDLLLTCASAQSRNFAYGLALGRGESLPKAGRWPRAWRRPAIAARIARERGIDAPIIAAVAASCDGAITIDEAVVGADVAAAAQRSRMS